MNPAPTAPTDGSRAGKPTRHIRTIASGGIDDLEAAAPESVL
ncbi:hypothetical protein [Streptomyces sp. NPDC015350]